MTIALWACQFETVPYTFVPISRGTLQSGSCSECAGIWFHVLPTSHFLSMVAWMKHLAVRLVQLTASSSTSFIEANDGQQKGKLISVDLLMVAIIKAFILEYAFSTRDPCLEKKGCDRRACELCG